MTLLHLVRHGETVWHAENRYAGSSDVALTAAGHAQARDLAAWAGRTRPDLVAASDLSRSWLTAEPVAQACGARLRVEPRLREVSFGAGEGLARAEMRQRFPAELEAFLAAPASTPLPSGEAGVDAVERALAAITDLVAGCPDGRVLVIAHSTLNRLLLCRLLGLPIDDYRRRFPVIANVAITTLRLASPDPCDRAALLELNVPTRRTAP